MNEVQVHLCLEFQYNRWEAIRYLGNIDYVVFFVQEYCWCRNMCSTGRVYESSSHRVNEFWLQCKKTAQSICTRFVLFR